MVVSATRSLQLGAVTATCDVLLYRFGFLHGNNTVLLQQLEVCTFEWPQLPDTFSPNNNQHDQYVNQFNDKVICLGSVGIDSAPTR